MQNLDSTVSCKALLIWLCLNFLPHHLLYSPLSQPLIWSSKHWTSYFSWKAYSLTSSLHFISAMSFACICFFASHVFLGMIPSGHMIFTVNVISFKWLSITTSLKYITYPVTPLDHPVLFSWRHLLLMVVALLLCFLPSTGKVCLLLNIVPLVSGTQ